MNTKQEQTAKLGGMTIRYIGSRPDGHHAQVMREENGKAAPLPLRLDLRSHSPSGFDWGYAGSGPAQLALAILTDAIGSHGSIPELYQAFKAEIISTFDVEGFTIHRGQVLNWYTNHPEYEKRLSEEELEEP